MVGKIEVDIRQSAKTLSKVLSLWYRVMGTTDVPMQVAAVFAYVAEHSPREVPQQMIVKDLGMTEASVSRNLTLLTVGRSALAPGPGLVSGREDPEYRRRRLIALSPKGHQFAAEMARLMQQQEDV